jgi:hypothetical protein
LRSLSTWSILYVRRSAWRAVWVRLVVFWFPRRTVLAHFSQTGSVPVKGKRNGQQIPIVICAGDAQSCWCGVLRYFISIVTYW